jgi:hypothetical protein
MTFVRNRIQRRHHDDTPRLEYQFVHDDHRVGFLRWPWGRECCPQDVTRLEERKARSML